jgi:hypothetical protein
VVALFTVLSPGHTPSSSEAQLSSSGGGSVTAADNSGTQPGTAQATNSAPSTPSSSPISSAQALTDVRTFYTDYTKDVDGNVSTSTIATLEQRYVSPELIPSLAAYADGAGVDAILRAQDTPASMQYTLSQMATSSGLKGYAVVDVTQSWSGQSASTGVTVVVRLSDGLITYIG